MKIAVGALLMIVLLDRAAAEQPAPTSAPPPSNAAAGTSTGAQKDEDAALAIAVGATFASWSVLLLGLEGDHGAAVVIGGLSAVILPSAGHWYARSPGALGLAMRTAGGAGLTWAIIKDARCNDEGCEGTNAQRAIALGGLGLLVAGTIVDIATAPAAARRHNRAARDLIIAPVVHARGAGLAISGAF